MTVFVLIKVVLLMISFFVWLVVKEMCEERENVGVVGRKALLL